ncbi:hypothetical protein ACSQ67_012969 [Phaseolus vulgaris]
MRQVLRRALSALTSCINLFDTLRNLFWLKFSRVDSITDGSASHHVDATSMGLIPTPSRMALKEEQRTYLSHDLLSRIASCLGLMDFLTFRCVCKDWHIASSGVSHEDKSSVFEPWFLIYGAADSQCSLISNEYKRYTSHIREMDGSACLASYEGWLLLFRQVFGQGSLFFFSPFSKAKIDLPNCPFTVVTDHIAAFSTVPTAQDCTVVVVSSSSFYELQLFMLCRGEKVWTQYRFLGYNKRIKTALFYEGEEFHFLDGANGLITFNPSRNPEWKSYYIHATTHLSSEVLVLKYTLNESLFEHHNDTGMVRYLEEKDSISTCGTTVPHYRGRWDMVIGSESIAAKNQSETRHLKGVWIQPKYCYVPPRQRW